MASGDIQVNVELENKMRAKFAPLEKIYNRITGFEVSMKSLDTSSEKKCMVEGRVLIPKSSFFCREREKTFEEALTLVIENLTRQLKCQKEERPEIW